MHFFFLVLLVFLLLFIGIVYCFRLRETMLALFKTMVLLKKFFLKTAREHDGLVELHLLALELLLIDPRPLDGRYGDRCGDRRSWG